MQQPLFSQFVRKALGAAALSFAALSAHAANPLALSGSLNSLIASGVNEGNASALSFTNGAYSGSDLFLSLTFQLGSSFTPNTTSATGRTYEDFVGVWLDSTNTGNHTTVPNFGFKGADGAGNDALIRTSTTASDTVRFTNSALTAGQTFTILVHLAKTGVSTTYNKIEGWFNPTSADTAGTADITLTKNTGLSSISYLGVRSNLDTADTVALSSFKVGSSFAAVSPVPEASGLAMLLAGLGMMGFIARRRTRI